MTPITSRDVENATFDLRLRGYDTDQVDAVLDRAASTLHAHEREFLHARRRPSYAQLTRWHRRSI